MKVPRESLGSGGQSLNGPRESLRSSKQFWRRSAVKGATGHHRSPSRADVFRAGRTSARVKSIIPGRVTRNEPRHGRAVSHRVAAVATVLKASPNRYEIQNDSGRRPVVPRWYRGARAPSRSSRSFGISGACRWREGSGTGRTVREAIRGVGPHRRVVCRAERGPVRGSALRLSCPGGWGLALARPAVWVVGPWSWRRVF